MLGYAIQEDTSNYHYNFHDTTEISHQVKDAVDPSLMDDLLIVSVHTRLNDRAFKRFNVIIDGVIVLFGHDLVNINEVVTISIRISDLDHSFS